MQCPVCGQEGLPDYHAENVICSQCNSNLESYALLKRLKSRDVRSRFFMYATLVLLVLVMAWTFLNKWKGPDYKVKYSDLLDSLAFINNQARELKTLDSSKGQAVFRYVVKRGDYTWKIAELFYGNGKLYGKIEKDNGLSQPYLLKEGQVILIKQ